MMALSEVIALPAERVETDKASPVSVLSAAVDIQQLLNPVSDLIGLQLLQQSHLNFKGTL